jgi:hypothetical protein
MATIRVPLEDVSDVVRRKISGHLRKKSSASILVDNAKKRIREGGDSEIKYPDLWSVKYGVGYRKGGKPLLDTGVLMNLLWAKATKHVGEGLTWTLMDGSGYGVKHQEGFFNEGPIAIALSPKAKKLIQAQGDPPHDLAFLDSMGLEEAPNMFEARNPKDGSIKWDYYVIEDGGKVPARPIANMPPEDVNSVVKHIEKIIKELTWH